METNENDSPGRPELIELLFRLQWLLRRRHFQHVRGHGPLAAPHQGQGRVLALLKLKSALSQKELSTILDIRSQSLGELLTKLERQGLITRTASPDDKRSLIVHLTEAGRAASEEQLDGPDLDGLFGVLQDEEQEKLADYLARLIAKLEEELGPEPADRGFGFPGGFPGGPHGMWKHFGRGHGPGPGFGF